jgi:hypothetical protein
MENLGKCETCTKTIGTKQGSTYFAAHRNNLFDLHFDFFVFKKINPQSNFLNALYTYLTGRGKNCILKTRLIYKLQRSAYLLFIIEHFHNFSSNNIGSHSKYLYIKSELLIACLTIITTEFNEKFRRGIYKIFMYSTLKCNNKQETSFLHLFMNMFNDSFCLSYSDYI